MAQATDRRGTVSSAAEPIGPVVLLKVGMTLAPSAHFSATRRNTSPTICSFSDSSTVLKPKCVCPALPDAADDADDAVLALSQDAAELDTAR